MRANLDLIWNDVYLLPELEAPKARPVFSASEIDTFIDCPRKWAFKFLYEHVVEQEPNKWADLGREVHKILERWGLSGAKPDRTTQAGRVALKMIEKLPHPGIGHPEKRLYLTTRRHIYKVIFDLPYWDPLRGAVVIDHKTTTDLKWAKTPALLATDVQANMYGAAACAAFDVDNVTLIWNYGTTSAKPRGRVVEAKLSLDGIVEQFNQTIEVAADRLYSLTKQRPDPLTLPYDANVCEKYGGCAFRKTCNLSLEEKVRSAMSQSQTRNGGGLMDAVSQMQAYQPGQPARQQPVESMPPGQGNGAYAPPGYGAPTGQSPGAYGQQPGAYGQPQQAPAGQPGAYNQPQGGYGPQGAYGQPQGAYGAQAQPQQPQAPANGYYAPQGAAGGGLPSSPPNSPEGAQPQVNQQAAQQAQVVEQEKSKGKGGRRTSKGELRIEQQVFLAGLQGGIAAGVPMHQLRDCGRAALQAFQAEFPDG